MASLRLSAVVPMAFGLGCGDHGRVHLPEFGGLSGDGLFEVVRGGADRLQGLEVIVGMNGFGCCRGPKEPRHLGIAIFFGLFGKGQVFAIRLGLAGKGCLQILDALFHVVLPPQ